MCTCIVFTFVYQGPVVFVFVFIFRGILLSKVTPAVDFQSASDHGHAMTNCICVFICICVLFTFSFLLLFLFVFVFIASCFRSDPGSRFPASVWPRSYNGQLYDNPVTLFWYNSMTPLSLPYSRLDIDNIDPQSKYKYKPLLNSKIYLEK